MTPDISKQLAAKAVDRLPYTKVQRDDRDEYIETIAATYAPLLNPALQACKVLRQLDEALEAAWKAGDLPAIVISAPLVRETKSALAALDAVKKEREGQ